SAWLETLLGEDLGGARRPSFTPRLSGRFQENTVSPVAVARWSARPVATTRTSNATAINTRLSVASYLVRRMLTSARILSTGGSMLQISALQLAELLAGIARAQAAMVQGLENELAGVRSSRIVPALQNVAHPRYHPHPTPTD